jgi:hypothetical protein
MCGASRCSGGNGRLETCLSVTQDAYIMRDTEETTDFGILTSIIDLAAWIGLAALLWTLLPTAMLPEVVGAAVDAFFLYVREIGAVAMGYVTEQMSRSPNAMRVAAGAILVLFVASICRWIVQVRMQVRAEEAGRAGEAREARRDASHAEGSWTAQANGDMP